MSMQIYRTPDNDPVADKIAPLGDTTDIQHQFAKTPYITIEVRDRITDKTIVFLPQAWITRRSGSVQAEGLLTENWTIKSIGYMGPGGQASANGGGGALGALAGLIPPIPVALPSFP